MSYRERCPALALLVALVAAYGGWIVWVVANNQALDYMVYFLSGAAYAHGESPYTMAKPSWRALAAGLHISHFAWPYRYPPYTAALFRVLQPLGVQPVLVGWLVVNAVALIVAAWVVAQALGGGRRVAVSLALLLALGPAFDTLMFGQINGLLLLVLALAFWSLQRSRERLGGAALALGTAIKVTPAVLLAWLAFRGRWRAVGAAGAALVLLSLAALPFVGLQGFVDYWRHGLDLARPDLVITGATNVSFVGAMGRLLPHHLDLARTLGRALAAAVVVVTVALCCPWGRRARDARLVPLEFSLIVAALPLLPPFTWFHQLVTLLIPMVVVWTWVGEGQGWAAPPWFYRASFVTIFAVAVWAACARQLWWERRAALGAGRPPQRVAKAGSV